MNDDAVVQKLREIKPAFLLSPSIARLRVFDSSAIEKHDGEGRNIGILLDFEETPSLFDLSAMQNELEEELGVSVSLAVTGMIQPAWESRIENGAVDI